MMAFHNGFEDNITDGYINTTLCRNLLTLGSVVSEIMTLDCVHLGLDHAKFAYLTNYLRIYWIDLHQMFRIGRYMGGDNQIVLQSPMGLCCG